MILNQYNALVAMALFMGCFLISGCSDSVPVADKGSKSALDAVANRSVANRSVADPAQTLTSAAAESQPDPAAKESEVVEGKPAADSTAKAPAMKGMNGMGGMGKMKFPASKDMKFKDDVESNVEPPLSISDLVFTNKDGTLIKMVDYLGKKNVILVFTEGFNGMLCPFCKTQTSRLVANYVRFQKRDCEIIVVYPGPKHHLEEFVEAALKTEKEQVDKVPFPIVLDQEFKATEYFDIHSMHAHPSTYLIDKKGGVQFAYVGSDMSADRPSVKALIKKLDEIN